MVATQYHFLACEARFRGGPNFGSLFRLPLAEVDFCAWKLLRYITTGRSELSIYMLLGMVGSV